MSVYIVMASYGGLAKVSIYTVMDYILMADWGRYLYISYARYSYGRLAAVPIYTVVAYVVLADLGRYLHTQYTVMAYILLADLRRCLPIHSYGAVAQRLFLVFTAAFFEFYSGFF